MTKCVYLLQVYGEVLHLSLQPLLDLLQAGSSGLGRLRCLLSLLETHCKFAPGGEWVERKRDRRNRGIKLKSIKTSGINAEE